ncbi:MAG: glycosyltransferase [Opitutus sp.]|nr:glycosyltransferase [Opitutus sp.]
MKLLVLAQTPPPVHGQSLMVQTLVDGLPAHGLALHHVNLRLSHDAADIGRWRAGKIWATLAGALHALAGRFRHGCDTLYYIPAPGKRGALYRDWLVMLLCRPFFKRLVLHWHATGLTAWLETEGTAVERAITRALLGRADLALALADELRVDAAYLTARRIAVVLNGLADPGPSPAHHPPRAPGERSEVLFLGLGSGSKGLFDTLAALALALPREPGAFRLTIAGGFASAEDEREFHSRAAALGEAVRHAGFANDAQKHALLARADLLCFPTSYAHEGQPLVLIEALAHNLPIITTRWRAIPGMLPASGGVRFVAAGQPAQIADAMFELRARGRPDDALRQHYLAHFTRERHLAALAAALGGTS